MKDVLIKDGFTREDIMWSFSPKYYGKDGGKYYSKSIDAPGGYTDQIEVGVIMDESSNSMEVYMCDCVVGCCGDDMGIHPFSMEKLEELIEGYKRRPMSSE